MLWLFDFLLPYTFWCALAIPAPAIFFARTRFFSYSDLIHALAAHEAVTNLFKMKQFFLRLVVLALLLPCALSSASAQIISNFAGDYEILHYNTDKGHSASYELYYEYTVLNGTTTYVVYTGTQFRTRPSGDRDYGNGSPSLLVLKTDEEGNGFRIGDEDYREKFMEATDKAAFLDRAAFTTIKEGRKNATFHHFASNFNQFNVIFMRNVDAQKTQHFPALYLRSVSFCDGVLASAISAKLLYRGYAMDENGCTTDEYEVTELTIGQTQVTLNETLLFQVVSCPMGGGVGRTMHTFFLGNEQFNGTFLKGKLDYMSLQMVQPASWSDTTAVHASTVKDPGMEPTIEVTFGFFVGQ